MSLHKGVAVVTAAPFYFKFSNTDKTGRAAAIETNPTLRDNFVWLRYTPCERGYTMLPRLTENQAAVEELCHRCKVRRLDLFGSAAKGQERPGESDLDFLVDFEPLPPGSYADAYFELLEGLQRIFGRPVDLVVASAIRNPYFRESVERTKALVYAT